MSPRGAVNRVKRIGPRTLPWGTSHFNCDGFQNVLPPTNTCCVLDVRLKQKLTP